VIEKKFIYYEDHHYLDASLTLFELMSSTNKNLAVPQESRQFNLSWFVIATLVKTNLVKGKTGVPALWIDK
jgi:hypothetical protein